MVRLFVFLAAAGLVLLVLALISALAADRVRAMPRALWVLIILLVPVLGPLAYFLWGRPQPVHGEGPLRRPHRPSSPDDDPEFLRSMNTEQARRDRELLAALEAELHPPEPEPEPEPDPEPEPRGRDEVRDGNGEEKGPRPPASGV